ncbi:ABC transporter ATP-binding protein [Lipingzhangella sp. LS1_29]|uniref:ABC transporter ATP-binding protein n=1 Tax=Lipingzhangella rawalii TaxID=2055835 RepID=A0ABU2HAG6_9ACTN|nr:ABC transporter ATP-binding protein [Lipingzhangella rawalii]MDS1272271.1 ABC transporter ATP-binding protein [Lipingzhangella rawalii]
MTPTDTPERVYRRTYQLLRPHRGTLALAAILGILGTAAALAQPLAIGEVVAAVEAQQALMWPLLVLFVLFTLDAGIGALHVYLVGRVGTGVVLDSRLRLVDRLLRAPLKVHLDNRQGDLFTRAVADTSLLRTALAQGLSTLFVSALMITGTAVIMVAIDPLLAGLVAGCLLVSGAASGYVARLLRLATVRLRARVSEFGDACQRALGNVQTIKLSRGESREATRLGDRARAAYRDGLRVAVINATLYPAMNVGVQASFGVVFIVGGARLSTGSLTLPEFSAFLLYLFYLLTPVISGLQALAMVQQGMASVGRIGSVLDIEPEEEPPARASEADTARTAQPTHTPGERPTAASPPAPATPAAPVTTVNGAAPALSLHRVTFGYQPDQPVLDQVSFDLGPTGLVALVGPSGSGKTTVLGLCTRLWNPQSGQIRIQGRDAQELPLSQLRHQVAYVEQAAPVLDGSIRENLCYAAPEASNEAIDHVLDRLNLRTWVEQLPAGLDTPVGEAGTAISGGQRQRIAIARMLLCEPPVLLLDEAGSQLDATSERAMHHAIREESRHRLVVVVAHRLASVVDAHRILVLDEGHISAQGTHSQLARTNPTYQHIVRTHLDGDPAQTIPPDRTRAGQGG